MASAIKPSFHKRIFLLLLTFSWAIILCFVVFQYAREKEFKQEFLSAQLHQYNSHLLNVIEEGLPYEDYIASHTQPFENLRISIIAVSGAVVYDSELPLESLDNHRNRPEIANALKHGSGYHIGRQSASDGRQYFYSASKGERVIVRTAIPYSLSLHELLKPDWAFLWVMFGICMVMSLLAYFATRRVGKAIERLNYFVAHEASMREEQEKSRIKRELTNNINHELKTPVASMQVCLETLLSGIKLSEDKKQELIERCYDNNDRLRRLLNDVSLITRLEDGSQIISKERVCINEIIIEISDELAIMPEEERLNFHVRFDDEVYIWGNLSLISSIFRNLTENAISYSGGKNIYVTLVENNDQQCRISFEDDGCGVDEVQLPRLFERFYRVDKGRSRRMGGTGLGLSIVKHAVLFHGGTITVANRSNGGLVFEFSLQKRERV